MPRPTPRPQVSASCAGVITNVEADVATAINASANSVMRRTPSPSMKAAANGPTAP